VPEQGESAHSQAMTRDLLVDNLAYRSGTVLMFQPVRTCCDGSATSRRRTRSSCTGCAAPGGLGFGKAMPIVLRDEETLRQP